MLRRLVLLVTLGIVCVGVRAKVVLPDILSDNMVLQHSTKVNLWGKAAPHSTVDITVSWSKDAVSCMVDEEGNWLTQISTPAASYEPQEITFSDKDDPVTLSNILFGEVWFCSGQSNMEMTLKGYDNCPVEKGAELIATSGKWKGIRVVKIPHNPALVPLEETPGKWKVSSPKDAPEFTAVGYTFAQMLHSALDVPVGIIDCSWGGTRVEGWSSEKTLSAYPDVDVEKTFKEYVQPENPWEWSSHLPMVMFNGMLHPLHNYTIKGFLWYQGCANVGHADTYADRLCNMVKEWRELWNQGDIPFYLVELAPYVYGGDGISGALLRESQFKASRMIPNSGIVCTNDLVYPSETLQIHPCKKQEIGHRLAYLALNKTYGYDTVVCEGLVYKEMKVVDGQVEVRFYNDQMGSGNWGDLTGFELAGEDKVFYPAEARFVTKERKVVVHSDSVSSPVAVRYCFKDFSVGNLTGGCFLPTFPFRSDEW